MSTLAQERFSLKATVNRKHCCKCFVLRRDTLFALFISLILIISFGLPYFTKPSNTNLAQYYTCITITATETISFFVGWLSVYFHWQRIIQPFIFWRCAHLIIVSIIVALFWTFNLLKLDYVFCVFFIIWVLVQLVLIGMLLKFKSLLKTVYAFAAKDDDNAYEETETFDVDASKELKIEQTRKYTASDHTVSVSINLTQPQYQTIQPLSGHILPNMRVQPSPMQASVSNEAYSNIHAGNNRSNHYKNIPTEDTEIKLEVPEQAEYSSSGYSEDLYRRSKETKTTKGLEEIKQLDSMDLLLSKSDPLPDDDDDAEMERLMSNEGIDYVLSDWVLNALKECAPIDGEWREYWKRFKDNKVNEETLKCLNADKERSEWAQLIPKIGPRIQFQQMLHHKLSNIHYYPSPK